MKKILAIILVCAFLAMPMAVSAEQIDLVNENPAYSINRAAVAPTIDGNIDEQAYTKLPAVQGDFSWNDNDTGILNWMMNDAGVEAWISYDDANFYVLLSASSGNYFMDIDDPGSIWQHSGIQISVAPGNAVGGDRLELGIARNSSTGEILVNLWADGPDGPLDWDIEASAHAVAIVGNRKNYEIAIPWTSFLPAAPSTGDTFGFNFIYHFVPDESTRTIAEFAAGCAYGKDAEQFGKLTLTGEPTWVAPPEPDPEPDAPEPAAPDAPAPEAPAPRPSPRTNDAGVVALIALMSIAAAGIVVLRRRTN